MVINPAVANTAVEVRFGAARGQSYRIESSMDLQSSQFLISTENDLALFDVSGELVNQPHMGFGVEEIELV